jgi:hypothetical protein
MFTKWFEFGRKSDVSTAACKADGETVEDSLWFRAMHMSRFNLHGADKKFKLEKGVERLRNARLECSRRRIGCCFIFIFIFILFYFCSFCIYLFIGVGGCKQDNVHFLL